MKLRSAGKRNGRAAIGIAVGIVLMSVILAVLLSCRVSRFEISGNEYYSDQELIEASGIKEGSFLFTLDREAARNRILEKCTRVSTVAVGIFPLDCVVIRVTEEEGLYSANIEGRTFCFTDGLRVIGFGGDSGTVPVQLPEVLRAIAGKTIEFSAGEQSYVSETLCAVAQSALWGRVTALDLTSARSASVTVDGRFVLILGDTQDLPLKFTVAASMLDDERLKTASGATLDLTNPKEVVVKRTD